MAQWYAVYTRPCWEKKVAESFQKRRMECYLPLNKVLVPSTYSERRKPVYQPLFEACVFVKTTEDKLPLIRSLDGVLSFFYWHGKPATIRDIEIEMIKRFTAEHQSVTLIKSAVSIGEIVRIINVDPEESAPGAWGQKVKLSLPSLGFVLEAEATETIPEPISAEELNLSTTLA
ncbi:Transcription antitermination factor NusG [Cnuella takakiae]|uniref:Transcription antitermination factor NusG n=1 Tax=Cnuella takakiae TaxID=1302690 RepID=A0A1M4YDN6_9BACT|nr:transcription termination/antitermination NusG family protein [Cnuella takakiae]OLY93121.1 hypothetical protein BUE76_15410 [Cnuella takakiae]SHF03870.1 Transcription antitermination factor NusG [Cnuella takakiae]